MLRPADLKNKRIKATTVLVLLFFMLSAVMFVMKNHNSIQSNDVFIPRVALVGEYKVGDGEWKEIVPGQHIPACKGDVTLKGIFELRHPDTDDFLGMVTNGFQIVFNLNHIGFSVDMPDGGEYISDNENSYFGESACGHVWGVFDYPGEKGEITITFKNKHRFGNDNAIDLFLKSTYIYTGMQFENAAIDFGEPERIIGIVIIISAFIVLGIGVFSALLKIKMHREIFLGGFLMLFAGIYFIYSSRAVYFWNDRVVFNTMCKGLSAMAYVLFCLILICSLLRGRAKKAGRIVVAIYTAMLIVITALALFEKMYFYDTIFLWIIITLIAGFVLLGILAAAFRGLMKKERVTAVFFMVWFIAFVCDVVAASAALWPTAFVSKIVFLMVFIISFITILRVVPQNINASEKAKMLENEKLALNAELAESRISTMISQIRPHFIYNTLGSIEQLCELDPPQAARLVNNFAKYLRGNFGELDNPRLIRLSREIEHTKYYVSIEKVRFPDMEFEFEFNSTDFSLPALTIQPIVENAIKHGIMKLSHGGRVQVKTYETQEDYCICVEDNGAGFDVSGLSDDKKHIGLRNIRERLKAMCGGRVIVESEIGKGTKVTVIIPKEAEK